eukprot:jgi/Mesen1/1436/ME001313S00483
MRRRPRVSPPGARLQDRTYSFVVTSPAVSYFLKRAAGVAGGASDAGHAKVGAVTLKHVYEIAKIKQADPGCEYMPLEGICRSIVGTAGSMGIEVKRSLDD